MSAATLLSPYSPAPSPPVMAGAIVHLADWLDTRCPRAARQAVLCLDHLSRTTSLDPALAAACRRLVDVLDPAVLP